MKTYNVRIAQNQTWVTVYNVGYISYTEQGVLLLWGEPEKLTIRHIFAPNGWFEVVPV